MFNVLLPVIVGGGIAIIAASLGHRFCTVCSRKQRRKGGGPRNLRSLLPRSMNTIIG
jgi:hypothetical protein